MSVTRRSADIGGASDAILATLEEIKRLLEQLVEAGGNVPDLPADVDRVERPRVDRPGPPGPP